MTDGNIEDINKYISNARLKSYLEACQNDYIKALKLYQANMRLSQSFYPLLSLVEVILRNALNEKFTVYFNDDHWLINQKDKIMKDSSLTYKDRKTGKTKNNYFLSDSISKSIEKSKSKPVTQGVIIADLNFGFWTAFFNKSHSALFRGVPMSIFVKLPSGYNRSTVAKILDKLREFRNRVYHNEPIIFKKQVNGLFEFNLLKVESTYQDIKSIFSWFNLDFKLWTKRIDHVAYEIENAKCVVDNYPQNKYYLKRILSDLKHYKELHI